MSVQLKRWMIGSAGALIIGAGGAMAQSPTTDPTNPSQNMEAPPQRPAQPMSQGQQAQPQAKAHQMQPAQPLPDQAKAKVVEDSRKLAADFAKAWNAHDAKAMAQLFTRDGTLLTPMGQSAVGREDVQKLFTEMHGDAMKSSNLTVNVDSVRALRHDLVIMDTSNTLTGAAPMPGQRPAPEKSHAVLITQRQEGKWKVHAMRVLAVPEQQVGVGGSGDMMNEQPAGQTQQPTHQGTDTGGSGQTMPPPDAGTHDMPNYVPE